MRNVIIMLIVILFGAFVSLAEVGELYNYAASEHGAKASSNGDAMSAHEKHPASGAIDGTCDMSRYADGGVWAGSVHVTKKTPAVWQVKFPEPVRVNRVIIYHIPSAGNQLIDFSLEYRLPKSKKFRRVIPYDNSWENPVRGNDAKISKLTFKTVKADSLRVVITKASPHSIAKYGYGHAYIVEFEAYLVDVDRERKAMERERQMFAEVGKLASIWHAKRTKRENQRLETLKKANAQVTESHAFAWVRKEKIRTSHTGLGVGHLSKLMPVLAKLGFNGIDPGRWRYASKAEGYEQAIKGTNDLAEKYNMHVTLWLPWYWYKNDKNFPDRNCMPDLTREGEYRRAVDFRGVKMPTAPCPLSDSFWRDLRANVLQVAKWSKKYRHIEGICLDLEGYGPSASRQSSDWYSYDFCFCDECFGRFLRRIGSKLRPSQISPNRRFALLKHAGREAVQAYYELLTDEVRHRAADVREAAHAINPDFVLQFYGTPIEPDNNVADWLEKSFQFKSWFGFALAQGFGTKRVPCIYKPLDAYDCRKGRWSITRRMIRVGDKWKYIEAGETLQKELDELGLYVVHLPGFVICNESSSADMKRGLEMAMKRGNGFWFNEGWMLLAMRNPKNPKPPYWSKGKENIENYYRILREVLREYVR